MREVLPYDQKSAFWLWPVFTVSLLMYVIGAYPSGLYFLNDDFIHIPPAATGSFAHGNQFRPLSNVTLWIDSLVWGKNASGFHLTNFLIHLTNAVLVFIFTKAVCKINGGLFWKEKACFAACFFLLYGSHTEPVFWIIGRGASLAAFFMLICLNCYFYNRSLIALGVGLLAFCGGLFCYESIWILPLLFLVLETVNRRENFWHSWKWTICSSVVFLVYLTYRLRFDHSLFGEYEAGLLRSVDVDALGYNYFSIFTRSFLPAVRSSTLFTILAGLFFSGLAISLFLLKRKGMNRRMLLILTGVCICGLPFISLGIDTHDTEGERFLYNPSIFCCLLLAEWVYALSQKRFPRMLMLITIGLLHVYVFFDASASYRHASKVVKTSIDCLENSAGAERLQAEGIPTQYKGALIFRSGFPEAVNWIMPGKFKNITLGSFKEITGKRIPDCIIKTNRGNGGVTIAWSGNDSISTR